MSSETVRIGVFPLEKDAQTCFERPDCKYPGSEVEILQMVFRLIGVNFTLSVFVIAPPSFTCTRQFIFNAFSRTVWLFIVLSVLLLYSTTLLINFVKVKTFHQDKPISRWFIELFATSITSFAVSSRVLLLVILFATFILTQLYQTDMYAFLSVPLTYDVPFRSIKQALDLVEQNKMYFAAFENQTLLCTPNQCNRFEQVIKKNPVRRAQTERNVQNLILKGGIYQSTIDSALLPGQLSWLNTDQHFLIVRDEDAPSYYVAYTFSKRKKKLLRKFNNALIEVLPAVSTITTGHGYNTKKTPFEVTSKYILLHFDAMRLYGIAGVLISIVFAVHAHPHMTSVKDLDLEKEKQYMLTTNEYYVEKVNQMAGISCDLCMRAVYGVNYDFIQLKKDVIDMIRLDCEALFHDRAEDIAECVRFLTTKVEKYSGKVEKILDSRHVCVLLRVCAANDESYEITKKIIEEKTDKDRR
ncbi:unnamed protein product [Caenorhabditis sp. 36 PRJEB53466]|nr:unnamed protein product [Caenorhabditis sp. 36 PRJEB53466]